jgi:DNA replication protein DnaC
MGSGSGPAAGSNLSGDHPKEMRMSIQKIQQKMERLKLNHTLPLISELFEEATKQKSSALDFFENLLTLEVEAREESRIAASLKVSGLPKGMHLDNFDYLFQPSVDKAKIDHLATCEFIRRHENVLFFGPPGVGKTHLAAALGVKAIELGFSVSYYTVEELLLQLKRRADIPVAKQRGRAYVKSALVVVDELGYQVLDRNETHLFFQFISARYMRVSTIITSNRSVKQWVHIFAADEMATTAILDRLFHRAHIFNIDGQSYRLKDFNEMIQGTKKEKKLRNGA